MKARNLPSPPIKARFQFDTATVAWVLIVAAVVGYVEQQGGRTRHIMADAPEVPIAKGEIVGLMVGALILNGLYVAAETAVDTLKSVHVRHVKEQGKGRAELLQELIDDRVRYTTACTLAGRGARLLLILLSFVLAISFWLDEAKGGPKTFDLTTFLWDLIMVAVPVSLLNLIAGELVPKSFASLYPHRTGLRLYRWIIGASVIFSLPAALLVGIANMVTRSFGGKASFTVPNQAEEEILTIVESAQESGEIEDEERELLASVFEFSDRVAREIMTPRVDVDAMPVASDPADVVRVMHESGHSRIPLYEDTDDQIVGIVHAKDLLMAMVGEGPIGIRSLMRPALFVPEGKNLHELLHEMRTSRSQMAVVQDEMGGTAGIVTIEDIVEELVGDIVDEYDQAEETEPEVVADKAGGFFVDGKTRLYVVNEETGAEFESEEFDTIGGYVFGLFGRQPRAGEEIEGGGFRFAVMDTDGRRILRLHLHPATSRENAELISES